MVFKKTPVNFFRPPFRETMDIRFVRLSNDLSKTNQLFLPCQGEVVRLRTGGVFPSFFIFNSSFSFAFSICTLIRKIQNIEHKMTRLELVPGESA